jgi:hypothetical protein
MTTAETSSLWNVDVYWRLDSQVRSASSVQTDGYFVKNKEERPSTEIDAAGEDDLAGNVNFRGGLTLNPKKHLDSTR